MYHYTVNENYNPQSGSIKYGLRQSERRQVGVFLHEQLIATRIVKYKSEENKFKALCLSKEPECKFKVYSDPEALPFMPLSNYTNAKKREMNMLAKKNLPKELQPPKIKNIENEGFIKKLALGWWSCTKVGIIENLLKSEFGFTDYSKASKEQIITLYEKYSLTYPAKMVG